MKIIVNELIGENCITLDEGQQLYDLIYPELVQGHEVELDFDKVTIFASPFFNAGIGQLLRDIEPEILNKLLKFTNLVPNGMYLRKRVIANAKQYYGADEETREAMDDIIAKQLSDS